MRRWMVNVINILTSDRGSRIVNKLTVDGAQAPESNLSRRNATTVYLLGYLELLRSS